MKLMTQPKPTTLLRADVSVARAAAWRHQGNLIHVRHHSGWGEAFS